MPNPLVIQGVAQGAQTIAQVLGANSAQKKREEQRRKQIAELNKSRGKSVIDVNMLMGNFDRSISADSAKLGRKIDKSLRLDTGQGQGALAETQIGRRVGMRGNLLTRDSIMTAENDRRIDDRIYDLENVDDPGISTGQTVGQLLGIAANTGANVLAQNQARSDAEKSAQLRADAVPRGVQPQAPGVGEYDRGYDVKKVAGNPYQTQNAVEQFTGGGGAEQQPFNFDALKVREYEAKINALDALAWQRRNRQGEKSVDVPDLAGMTRDLLGKRQSAYDKEKGAFYKDPNNYSINRLTGKETVLNQFNKEQPTMSNIFESEIAPKIPAYQKNYPEYFGANASDSISTLLGIPPTGGANSDFYTTLAREQASQTDGFSELTPEEQAQYIQMLSLQIQESGF